MTRRTLPLWLAAGLAGSVLPLVGPVSPSAHAAEDGICSEGDIPGTEVLADTTARTNPALERMHVPEAQGLVDGRPVRVVVIDSGVQAGLGVGGIL